MTKRQAKVERKAQTEVDEFLNGPIPTYKGKEEIKLKGWDHFAPVRGANDSRDTLSARAESGDDDVDM